MLGENTYTYGSSVVKLDKRINECQPRPPHGAQKMGDCGRSELGDVGSEATCRGILKIGICIFACKF